MSVLFLANQINKLKLLTESVNDVLFLKNTLYMMNKIVLRLLLKLVIITGRCEIGILR